MKSRWKRIALFGLPMVGVMAFLFWPVAAELHRHGELSMRIYDCNGMLLREVLNRRQELCYWADLDQIAPEMQSAMIAAEDKRFYQHPGLDGWALLRSLQLNVKHGRIVSGGSTITQQLVRQVYEIPRQWYYKPVEMALALRVECQLSKKEILEQYLNRMPFGNQIYGVETGSRRYFNKPAAVLSLSEAALLAGLPQSPSRYNPYRHVDLAQRRQQTVLQRMLQEGLIDSSRWLMARTTPLQISENKLSFQAPHFCRYLLTHYPDSRQQLQTELDVHLQNLLEEMVNGHLRTLEKNNVTNAAVLVIDNHSHGVKAYLGSADFFNVDLQGQVDGVTSLRQPGSSIKPFTYGLALESGYTTASILPDIQTFAASSAGDYTVHNYDEKFHGPVRLRTALACSYNVPAVRLLESLGADLLLQRLHLAGMHSLNQSASHYGLGLTLGNGEISLLELTRAFSALANGGRLHELSFLKTEKPTNETIVFSDKTTWLLTDMLSDARARAPAFGLASPLRLPFACAAKTGTTKDFRDNWTVGYTTDYTVGVWVGNFDGKPMRRISGITGAAPLFRDIMLALHRRRDPAPFALANGLVKKTICSRSGQLPGAFCQELLTEYFVAGSEPEQTCTVHYSLAWDQQADQPAGAGTRASQVVQRIVENWPAEFSAWLQENKVPTPPLRHEPYDRTDPEPLAVSFPDQGDLFKIDPILKREFQTILFTAVVPKHVRFVDWLVDGQKVATVNHPFSYRWQLQEGDHRLAVQVVENQQMRRSDEVMFRVF